MQQILINGISIEEFKGFLSDVIEEKLRNQFSGANMTHPDDVYLSRQEVANKLKISLPTLHSFTVTGVLTGYRIGRRVLYKESDIERSLTVIRSLKYKSK